MEAFGVRFAVNNAQRFEALRSLFTEVKRDKDAGQPRDPEEWVRLVPDEIKARFTWPTPEEREWIEPHAYPYGGIGPLIALAEAFGFTVLGVNEYGKYERRAQLLSGTGE
jgi:hypothetical protein